MKFNTNTENIKDVYVYIHSKKIYIIDISYNQIKQLYEYTIFTI